MITFIYLKVAVLMVLTLTLGYECHIHLYVCQKDYKLLRKTKTRKSNCFQCIAIAIASIYASTIDYASHKIHGVTFFIQASRHAFVFKESSDQLIKEQLIIVFLPHLQLLHNFPFCCVERHT
jgi:thiamine transporter ThiT